MNDKDIVHEWVSFSPPQELQIEVNHKDLALKEAEEVCSWLRKIINEQNPA